METKSYTKNKIESSEVTNLSDIPKHYKLESEGYIKRIDSIRSDLFILKRVQSPFSRSFAGYLEY